MSHYLFPSWKSLPTLILVSKLDLAFLSSSIWFGKLQFSDKKSNKAALKQTNFQSTPLTMNPIIPTCLEAWQQAWPRPASAFLAAVFDHPDHRDHLVHHLLHEFALFSEKLFSWAKAYLMPFVHFITLFSLFMNNNLVHFHSILQFNSPFIKLKKSEFQAIQPWARNKTNWTAAPDGGQTDNAAETVLVL